jgi:hypothetical protein
VAYESVHTTLPVKGDIVSFSYEAMARRSAPVNPIIYRVRMDLTWDDVIANQFTQNEFSRAHGNGQENLQVREEGFTSKAAGFWDKINMRGFLMELAKRKRLDPFRSETWSSITREDIKNSKVSEKRKNHEINNKNWTFPHNTKQSLQKSRCVYVLQKSCSIYFL